jgi:hypothetical protein
MGEGRRRQRAGSRRLSIGDVRQRLPAGAGMPRPAGRYDAGMSIREPPSVRHLRRSRGQLGYARILLEHIDVLVREIDRLQAPLALSDEAILDTAGPATDSIGGKDLWMFGREDLLRLAGDLLLAAEREREGHGARPDAGEG